jgi:hypothetical protein
MHKKNYEGESSNDGSEAGPMSPQRWLDMAVGALAVQGLVDAGLIEPAEVVRINVERCTGIRDALLAAGYQPTPDVEVETIAEFCELQPSQARVLWQAAQGAVKESASDQLVADRDLSLSLAEAARETATIARHGKAELLAKLEAIPWGDTVIEWSHNVVPALALVQQVTSPYLEVWNSELDGVYEGDEFSPQFAIEEGRPDPLPERMRLAHVARVITTIALCLGIDEAGHIFDDGKLARVIELVLAAYAPATDAG